MYVVWHSYVALGINWYDCWGLLMLVVLKQSQRVFQKWMKACYKEPNVFSKGMVLLNTSHVF